MFLKGTALGFSKQGYYTVDPSESIALDRSQSSFRLDNKNGRNKTNKVPCGNVIVRILLSAFSNSFK